MAWPSSPEMYAMPRQCHVPSWVAAPLPPPFLFPCVPIHPSCSHSSSNFASTTVHSSPRSVARMPELVLLSTNHATAPLFSSSASSAYDSGAPFLVDVRPFLFMPSAGCYYALSGFLRYVLLSAHPSETTFLPTTLQVPDIQAPDSQAPDSQAVWHQCRLPCLLPFSVITSIMLFGQKFKIYNKIKLLQGPLS